MHCSDDYRLQEITSNRSMRGIAAAIAGAILLTGCATAKVGDADKMEKAEPAKTTASSGPATVTLKAMNDVKKDPATVTLSAMNPKEEPKKEAAKAEPPGIQDDMHIVADGENLWCIAALREIYDDGLLWPLIYKRNMDLIKDPDLIYPGQELAIERDNTSEMLDAAANHARTRGAWAVGPLEDADTAYTNSQ